MRVLFNLFASAALIGGVMVLPAALATAATSCTATGFIRDGIDLTAVLINPTGTVSTTVDAGATVDSPQCDIGIYYGPGSTGTVNGATIQNARYFGVVNNGGTVNISNSSVTNIGDVPFSGAQHGNGILFESGTGTIKSNVVSQYQKNGIVLNLAGSSATIADNTVTGSGPVDYIAQNGIQVSRGAKATVTGNTVSANQYTGANNTSSAGILILGGPAFTTCGGPCPYTVGVTANKNTVTNNDVGIWLFNAAAGFIAPSTATNNTVKFNTISDNVVSNTTGYTTSPACGYQAGIADLGKKDLIVNNSISGFGYTKQTPDCDATQPVPAFLRLIDVTTKARGTPSNK
jgi:hypothetical protein